MKLTTQQKELIEIGKEKGYFTLQDTMKVYSSEQSRKSAIRRLILLDKIKEIAVGKFEIND